MIKLNDLEVDRKKLRQANLDVAEHYIVFTKKYGRKCAGGVSVEC